MTLDITLSKLVNQEPATLAKLIAEDAEQMRYSAALYAGSESCSRTSNSGAALSKTSAYPEPPSRVPKATAAQKAQKCGIIQLGRRQGDAKNDDAAPSNSNAVADARV